MSKKETGVPGVEDLEQYNKDRAEGYKPNGQFAKGNRMGAYSRRKDGVKSTIRKATSDEQAGQIFKKLLKSDNENVVLKALQMWLAYRLGKPTQIIESDTTIRIDQEIDEQVNDLLKELT